MNIIDSLVVTLGLDPSDYTKSRKEVSGDFKKFREEVADLSKRSNEHTKKMVEGFHGVKSAVVGLLAAFGVGLGLDNFIAGTMNSQASLGRLSQNLALSGSKLRAWGAIASEVGDKPDQAMAALQTVAGGLAEASIKGFSAFTNAARANGVVISEQTIKSQDYASVLVAISKRMSEMPTRQQGMQLASMLGVGSMSNELLLGPAELSRRLAEAEKLSGGSSAADLARAQQMQYQMALLQVRFDTIRNKLWNELAPVVMKIGEGLASWLDRVDWDKVINDVGEFFTSVSNVVKAVGGWKDVMIALGVILGLKVLSPVLGIVGGLARMIPLLASSAAGMSALAVAAAALGGAMVGTAIYQHGMANNASGRAAGGLVANVLAAFGNKTAKEATATAYFNGLSDADKKRAVSAFNAWAPAQQKASPFASVIKAYTAGYKRTPAAAPAPVPTDHEPHDNSTSAPTGGGADPLKSHIYGSNADLFSSLEARFNLPAGVLTRMYKQESSNGKNLVSPAGALGPMQFMPATAKDMGLQGNEVMDLDHSAAAAAKYLAQLLKQFHGDVKLAVAAYNEGAGNVRKYGINNKETRDYVAAVAGGAVPAASGKAAAGPSISSETSIGSVTINTQATDANGIAMAMRDRLQKHMLIDASNTVLN